jgi:hypothetical protein
MLRQTRTSGHLEARSKGRAESGQLREGVLRLSYRRSRRLEVSNVEARS